MPLRALAFAFAAGAACLQTQAALPEFRWLWLAPPVVLFAAWSPRAEPWRLLSALAWLGVAVLAGFFYASWRADLRLSEALDPAWSGRDVSLQGRVLDLPETTSRGQRFVFAVEQVLTPGAEVPGRIQLNRFEFRTDRVSAPVQAGDCLRVTARLRTPHGSVNPHGFDFEGWLLERGIRAQGRMIAVEAAETCGGQARAWLDRTRDAVRTHLAEALTGKPYAGVVVALAVGDQNAIPLEQWTLFRHTGVTHLMSISGLHVTLFSALTFWLVQAVWRRLPGLSLHVPARRAGAVLGLLAAAAYVALAGFGIPAQRTLYMLTAAVLTMLLSRTGSASRALAVALFVVVAIDPWAALAPGFWLSFGAVAALLYMGAGRLGKMPVWRIWVGAQAAATLALIPALLAIFHEFSLVSPLANAFAIPLISLVAVPVILLAAIVPWDGLAWLGHAVVATVMQGLFWLDALPQPVWHGARPSGLAILLALLGAAVLLMPRGLPGRWLGGVLFLPLLLPRLDTPAEGEAWLDVLDVGQGLAVVVRTANHVLVFDGGPRYASGEDAGARVVAPFLHAHGVRRLDTLVVSHDDADHSGGAASLQASHAPRRVLGTGVPPRTEAETLPGMQPCRAGERWHWDGVAFEVLHPPAHHYENRNYSGNDISCVLKLETAFGSALLAADVERLGEMNLLERVPDRLAADVFLVPHHGSTSSSMPELIAAIRPRYAVISVGRYNGYGHPKGEVLQRYRAAGADILRTDRDGGLAIRFGAQGIEIGQARSRDRRYWRAGPGT